MKHNNKKNKEYFKVKLYDNGKIEVEELNETNFHPSYLNAFFNSVGNKKDFIFTCCEKKDIEKIKLKILNYVMKEVKKDLDVLTKKYNSLLICQSKLINF